MHSYSIYAINNKCLILVFTGTTGRRVKRPAPAPPLSPTSSLPPRVSAAFSTPELAGGSRGDHLVTKLLGPPRGHRLKKSLSLSGSRSFFATMLAALKGGRSRSPALQRRSRSQESLHLAPIDQDQQIVSDAAVRAQLRRGATSNVRSLSAEPRHLPPQGPNRNRHGSGSSNDIPFSVRRPDRLFLGLGRLKYAPRERSPLTMRPLTPHEGTVKPPTPDHMSPVRYQVPGVSEAALYEIAAFEQLIARFMHTKAPRDVIGIPAPCRHS